MLDRYVVGLAYDGATKVAPLAYAGGHYVAKGAYHVGRYAGTQAVKGASCAEGYVYKAARCVLSKASETASQMRPALSKFAAHDYAGQLDEEDDEE
jgi:hypothetical protein